MIPLSFQGGSIGLRENRRDIRGFEIADSSARRSFEWDTAHFGALLRGKRLMCSDKREEATQCRQPAVSSADGCLVFLFEILEKSQNLRSGEVFQSKRCHRPLLMFGGEPQQGTPCIPISQHRPV